MPTPLLPQSLDTLVKMRENAGLIRQSNDLIQKSYFDLSATEVKIWLYIVCQIKPTDKELKPMEFRIRDFCKVMGINPNSGVAYKAVKTALKNVADSSLYIDLEGNGDETLMRWLSMAKMSKKRGVATIQIAQEMRPFLLELKERYTDVSSYYVSGLRGKYAIRLYQILKSYENLKAPIMITIQEIRKNMKLPDSYNWAKIKQRVLDSSIEEISNETDILLSYQTVKRNQVVTQVVFFLEKVPLEERSRRLAVAEARMGREIFNEVLYNMPVGNARYIDETEVTIETIKEEPGPIPYRCGSSKPLMLKTLNKYFSREKIEKGLSAKEKETLELLLKVLANLANKHSKGEELIDGGNKNNIDAINECLQQYETLDRWLAAAIHKYSNFFEGKGKLSNPVAYVSKSILNDIISADVLIKHYEEDTQAKEKNWMAQRNYRRLDSKKTKSD